MMYDDAMHPANAWKSEKMYMYPGDIEIKGFLRYIQEQPITEPPSLFSLHPNSNIKASLDESNKICE